MKNIVIIFSSIFIFYANLCLAESQTLSDSRILSRLEKIEKDLNLVQQKIYRGDKGFFAKFKKDKSTKPISVATMEARVDEMEESMRNINGKIEEVQHSIDSLNAKLEQYISEIQEQISASPHQTVAPINTLSPDSKQSGKNNAPSKKKSPSNFKNAQEEYESAFILLRKAKYKSAQQAFELFIENNPNSPLIGNAYYWLGETYYVRNDYKKSAISFLRGYKNYPDSSKRQDNLLKLAMSLARLDKKDDACSTFNKLTQEFPNISGAIKEKVQSERKRIACQ